MEKIWQMKSVNGVSYNLSLTEAMARGILPIPIYVLAKYIFKEDLEELLNKAEQIEDEEKKNEVKSLITQASRKLENAQGLQELFEKYMEPNGKYIIFCRSIEHLNRLEKIISEEGSWFSKVNSNLNIVKISYENEKAENAKIIEFLRAKTNDGLTIALCIDMLNESFHDEDIAGIIMTRPTKSEVMFRQQLGRALVREGLKTPIIFDLVNNIKYFELLRLEIKQIIERETAKGNTKLYDEKILNEFKILGEQLEAMEAFDKIEQTLTEYLQGLTSVRGTLNICKKLHEMGLNFNELNLQKGNSFIKFSDLPLPKEKLEKIMRGRENS